MRQKLIIIVTMLMMLLYTSISSAAIPNDVSDSKYIKAYLRGTQNVPAYRDASLRTRGNSRGVYNAAVYPSDEMRIYQMNGSVARIGYIAGNSWVTAYIPTSAITLNNASRDRQQFNNGIGQGNVFARPNGTVYSGSSIDRGDYVWKLAEENGYSQVVYPAGNVYKMAWIRTNDYNGRTGGGSAVYTQNVKPSNLNIATDKGVYTVGETINFTFSATNATNLYIPIDVNGKRAYWNDVTGRNSFSFKTTQVGTYGFFLHGKNSAGEVSGAYKEIRVVAASPIAPVSRDPIVPSGYSVAYPSNGTYSLQPLHTSGKELSVKGAGTANSTRVVIDTIGHQNHQKWEIRRVNGDWYTIKDVNSGKYLDNCGGVGKNGNVVSIWPDTAAPEQWRFINAGNGTYFIQAKAPNKYFLDVWGAETYANALVGLYQFNGSNAQRWKLEVSQNYETRSITFYNDQVVDTFNGVEAKYKYGNCDKDDIYSCAALVKRYYSRMYGVDIYNLVPNATPMVGNGRYLTKVSSPQVGDVVGMNNSKGTVNGHWGIVKAVEGGKIVLFEQNMKTATQRTITVNRRINVSECRFYRL